ncbi:MAG: GNAT family N-acetyltransferase [Geminocystis sp.]|nr:GNAT family N-acetyltransferase [Geminocystis sp.]HIK37821.1 GNAT family N-acetyltransferase [Geminocystis sp. M7585_C2015_104]MCS7148708.1 GNAT family N-acetyltransferase [Geminocystis sp.]MCX8078418.1 GNAT family N-acetyltransferase [Geminocystis sp.]MDW8116143.1 GNAT family N-acetyltransferase [Geminocystis sp.]
MVENVFKIRPARPGDVETLFELIRALADYEKLTDSVKGNPQSLAKHLFSQPAYAEAIVAEVQGKLVGFALFYPNYSTFLTKPGIHLEDLFVLPEYRRQGIGSALLKYVVNLAKERDFGRVEWNVLEWNKPAIIFYEKMGAHLLNEWRICRINLDEY